MVGSSRGDEVPLDHDSARQRLCPARRGLSPSFGHLSATAQDRRRCSAFSPLSALVR